MAIVHRFPDRRKTTRRTADQLLQKSHRMLTELLEAYAKHVRFYVNRYDGATQAQIHDVESLTMILCDLREDIDLAFAAWVTDETAALTEEDSYEFMHRNMEA